MNLKKPNGKAATRSATLCRLLTKVFMPAILKAFRKLSMVCWLW